MATAWSIAGEYLEACSCAYVCPCITGNLSAPATEDFCKFAMSFRVDSGRFGATELSGVTFAVVGQSKKVMGEGGWLVGLIVDQRASDAQADAIVQISSGRAGGPMAALAPLIGEFRGLERHPIRFDVAGGRRSATVPGILEQEVEGVSSLAVTDQYLAVDNVAHPANSRLNLATAVRNVIACFGIDWRDQGRRRNGHFAPFAWNGSA
jgi:hypothetical protein